MRNSKIDKPKTSKKKEVTSIEDMPIVKLKRDVKTTKYALDKKRATDKR